MPMEWVDNVSDWRWVSRDNKIYAPNPNWFPTLPTKFRDMIMHADGEQANEIQDTLANHLLDKSDVDHVSILRYKPVHVFPLELDEVLVSYLIIN